VRLRWLRLRLWLAWRRLPRELRARHTYGERIE